MSRDHPCRRPHSRGRRPLTAIGSLVAIVLLGLSSAAYAHNTGSTYNFSWCFGSWWSDAQSKHVEAGMDDSPTSTSAGLCKASRVEVRMRDDAGVFYTEVDEDVLMPLFAEVDETYWYILYSNHKSKDENNTWWSTTAQHNHY